MDELELAKATLEKQRLSLVVVKSSEILFTSRASGVLGLVEAIRICGANLKGSVVADRVIGKAAALLCAYSGIAAVYAVVLSGPGKKTLKDFGIFVGHQKLVPGILNRDRNGMCPFEKLTEKISYPEEGYHSIRHCLCSSGIISVQKHEQMSPATKRV